MHTTRTRKTRSLAIAAVATGLLAGGITAGTTDLFRGETPTRSADTVQPAAAEAKQAPPECNTGWKRYKPRKTFMWDKKTDWFRINDAVHVQFRSRGGEFFYRYDHNCKRVQAWKGYAGEFRTMAKGPEAYVPRVSSWHPAQETCGKTDRVNVIIGCYRGKIRYQEVNPGPIR